MRRVSAPYSSTISSGFTTLQKGAVTKGEYRTLLTLLNPVAPHITEELWQICGFAGKIYQTSWARAAFSLPYCSTRRFCSSWV